METMTAVFPTEQRQVFGPFFDGQGAAFADPVAVRRKLKVLTGGNPAKLLADYNSEFPDLALRAAEQFLQAVCLAFGLVPLDRATGQGLREDEVVAVWNSFVAWEKKKLPTPPTSPASSAPSASGPQATPSTTQPGSAFSSTKSGCGCGSPGT